MSHEVVITVTKVKQNIKLGKTEFWQPCLHPSDCTPIYSEEVAGDEKADGVTDHNDEDNEVEIDEIGCFNKLLTGIIY